MWVRLLLVTKMDVTYACTCRKGSLSLVEAIILSLRMSTLKRADCSGTLGGGVGGEVRVSQMRFSVGLKVWNILWIFDRL